jgi:DNA-binding GntR family transcriptional regulator
LRPENVKLLVLEPEASDAVVKASFGVGLVFGGKAETPDLTKPQWRQVYEDIRTDIENCRLQANDRIPPVAHVVKMYGFSSASVNKALQILQTEGWIEGRSRVGRFVRPRPPARRGASRSGG